MYNFDLKDPETVKNLKSLCEQETKFEEENFGPESRILIRLSGGDLKCSLYILYCTDKNPANPQVTYVGRNEYIVRRKILDELVERKVGFEKLHPDGSPIDAFKYPVKAVSVGGINQYLKMALLVFFSLFGCFSLLSEHDIWFTFLSFVGIFSVFEVDSYRFCYWHCDSIWKTIGPNKYLQIIEHALSQDFEKEKEDNITNGLFQYYHHWDF